MEASIILIATLMIFISVFLKHFKKYDPTFTDGDLVCVRDVFDPDGWLPEMKDLIGRFGTVQKVHTETSLTGEYFVEVFFAQEEKKYVFINTELVKVDAA